MEVAAALLPKVHAAMPQVELRGYRGPEQSFRGLRRQEDWYAEYLD
jgi:hypothetical protein